MFRSVLIANRGEIAVRVIRACREMDIRSVAVHSDVDCGAMHVRLADEAVSLGGETAGESYLNVPKLLDAIRSSRADAVHPGYGFLSENADFAAAVASAGAVFVGPPPDAMRKVGSKTSARTLAAAAGVPVVPGTAKDLSDAEAAVEAKRIGYPVMLKASGGGGGKGMRLVASEGELASALQRARGEAQSAFGNPAVYLERAIVAPRHVEMQVLWDAKGNGVALGERECSVQRRHQKLIEEAPSPLVTPELRKRLADAALAVTRAAGYINAGTVEFLVDAERNFYFLEVNARLQVEHPVTEMTSGLDLVKEQLRIASGEPLSPAARSATVRGWAIECRLYAEDPDRGFAPSPGRIRRLRLPAGPGIRVDSGVQAGDDVSVYYDPLIAKIVAWGEDRAEALARMRRALAETVIQGDVRTAQPFLLRVLSDERFARGEMDTGLADRLRDEPVRDDPAFLSAAMAAVVLHRARTDSAAATPASAGGPGTGWVSPWKTDAARSAVRRSPR